MDESYVEDVERKTTERFPQSTAASLSINDLPLEILYMVLGHLSPMLYPLVRCVCSKWDKTVTTHLYKTVLHKEQSPPTMESALCWFIENNLLFHKVLQVIEDKSSIDGDDDDNDDEEDSADSSTEKSTRKVVVREFFLNTSSGVFFPSTSDYGVLRQIVEPACRWFRKEASVVQWTVNSLIYGWDSKRCAIQQHKYTHLGDPLKRRPITHIPRSIIVSALRSKDPETVQWILYRNVIGSVCPIGKKREIDEIFDRLIAIAVETRTNSYAGKVFEQYLYHGPLRCILETERLKAIQKYFYQAQVLNGSSVFRRNPASMQESYAGEELLDALDTHMGFLADLLIEYGSLSAIQSLYTFDSRVGSAMNVDRNLTAFYRVCLRQGTMLGIHSALERSEEFRDIIANGNGHIDGGRERIQVHMKRALTMCRLDVFDWLYEIALEIPRAIHGPGSLSTPSSDITTAHWVSGVLENHFTKSHYLTWVHLDSQSPDSYSIAYCMASQYSHDPDTHEAVFVGADRSDYHYVRWLQRKVQAPLGNQATVIASTIGNTRLLRYIREEGKSNSPFSSSSSSYSGEMSYSCSHIAALYGHYETFVWLVRHGCLWNEVQIASMLKPYTERLQIRDHRRILEWIHENGVYGPGVEHMRRGPLNPLDPYSSKLCCPSDCDSDANSDDDDDYIETK